MLKSVMKELVLILLIILAIILVLGIFLYDYIPTNKIVPKIEQYQVPNTVKEELQDKIEDIEANKTQIIYEINGTDLKNYEKSQDYQKGKVNPFGDDNANIQPTSTQTTGNSNNSTSSNTPTSSNTNSNVNNEPATSSNINNSKTKSESVGNYLPNTGTK